MILKIKFYFTNRKVKIQTNYNKQDHAYSTSLLHLEYNTLKVFELLLRVMNEGL